MHVEKMSLAHQCIAQTQGMQHFWNGKSSLGEMRAVYYYILYYTTVRARGENVSECLSAHHCVDFFQQWLGVVATDCSWDNSPWGIYSSAVSNTLFSYTTTIYSIKDINSGASYLTVHMTSLRFNDWVWEIKIERATIFMVTFRIYLNAFYSAQFSKWICKFVPSWAKGVVFYLYMRKTYQIYNDFPPCILEYILGISNSPYFITQRRHTLHTHFIFLDGLGKR